MNTILKYKMIIVWGSLLGVASAWASQEQETVQSKEEASPDPRPAFVNIGRVEVPTGALPEYILQALQRQQESLRIEIKNQDFLIQKLEEDKKIREELRATIQEKKAWISQNAYLDPDCLQKCSAGEIVLIHGFAQQVDTLKKQICQLRLENDLLIKNQQQVSFEVSRLANKIEPLENKVSELSILAAQRQQTIDSLKEDNERLKEEKEAIRRELEEQSVLT